MPRGFSVAQRAALAAGVVDLPLFASVALPSGTVRAWNRAGNVVIGGNTWYGLGEMGVVDGIESSEAHTATGFSISLVGLPGDFLTAGLVDETRADRVQMAPVDILLGVRDGAGALIGDPVVIASGLADTLAFTRGATCTVTLYVEGYSALLRRANGLRMTTESHNARLGNPTPRDLFFEPQDRLQGRPQPLLS